jgi:hypothetical protein
MKISDALPMYRVRRSKIHGTGVFAARDIKKGTRITEYVGDRISHAEADRRYADKADDDNHTFLFTVDNRVVIDGGIGGNDARYINHSCDPNCETVIDERKVFIEAIRDIRKGDELGYDYLIERDASDPPDVDVIWACRCGSPKCRGTMLLPKKSKRERKAKKASKKSSGKALQKVAKNAVKGSVAKSAKKSVKKSAKKVAKKAVKKAAKKAAKRPVRRSAGNGNAPKGTAAARPVSRSKASAQSKAAARGAVVGKGVSKQAQRVKAAAKTASTPRSGRAVGGSARQSR